MSLALGRRYIDKNNCKTLADAIDAIVDLSDALGNPVNNPGPGPDGTVPDLYEPVYVDADGNLTTGTVLTTVKVVYGLATDDVDAGPGTFTIDSIVSLTEGFAAPAEPLTVNNTIGSQISNNAAVYAIWNPTAEQWETWTDTGGAGTAYSAGLGLELVTNEFAMYDGNYSGTGYEIYISEAGSFNWRELKVALEYLGDYDDSEHSTQVIGHEESGDVKFYGMATVAKGLAQGDVDNTAATFTGDGFTVLCGATISATETIQNPCGIGIDDNEEVYVVKRHDADEWHLLQSAPEAVALGQAAGSVSSGSATFAANTFTSLWGKAPSSTETVQNTFAMDCADDDPVWAVRFPGSATWYAVQMKGIEIDVVTEVTSLEIAGNELVLNFKKAKVRVPAITVDEAEDSITIAVTECE